MRRTPLLRALSVVALVIGMLAGNAALAESSAGEQKLYLRNDGANCGANDHPFLSEIAGTTDINCGYIGGGLPFGEIFHHAEVDTGRTFVTQEEVSYTLDGTRKVTGVVTVRKGNSPRQSVALPPGTTDPVVVNSQPLPGGGQIVADIALRGSDAQGNYFDFGALTLEGVVPPNKERVELPFELEVPADANGATLSVVEFDLNVRGVHLWHGFMELNGMTSFTLPTVAEATPAQ